MAGLNDEVLRELQPLHEEWAGVALEPSVAYGLRVYQTGSSLTMHTDRLETHVISSILHVDRDYGDEEPWPIVIEGVDGAFPKPFDALFVIVYICRFSLNPPARSALHVHKYSHESF